MYCKRAQLTWGGIVLVSLACREVRLLIRDEPLPVSLSATSPEYYSICTFFSQPPSDHRHARRNHTSSRCGTNAAVLYLWCVTRPILDREEAVLSTVAMLQRWASGGGGGGR